MNLNIIDNILLPKEALKIFKVLLKIDNKANKEF